MILFRLLSWHYFRKHRLRSLLTIGGIAIGIAVFLGMHAANRSVLRALSETVNRLAGKAQLQISADESGVPEEVLDRVQRMPEVKAAVPVIEAVVDTGIKAQGNLLVLGVDMTGDQSLREYNLEGTDRNSIEDPMSLLAQANSLLVTREFASRNNLKVDSTLLLNTVAGPTQFTVSGIFESSGLVSAFGGSIAIMDVYAAQIAFGRGRRFDRIDLVLQNDLPVQRAQMSLQERLGHGVQVEPASKRGQQFESLLRVYLLGMNLSSTFALVIGMFIIYNSFSIAVTQRCSEIGILRALGATRGQIRFLFLAEGMVFGLAGTLVGTVGGIFLAQLVANHIGQLLESEYSVLRTPGEMLFDPVLLAATVAVGILTSLIGSGVPSNSAARIEPLQALHKGRIHLISKVDQRLRGRLAVITAIGSLVCRLVGESKASAYLGFLLVPITVLLLTPALVIFLAKRLHRVFNFLLPVEGALAVDSVIQAPKRASAAVSALMLSLAISIALSGVAGSSYLSMRDWLTSTLNPDLFVSTSAKLGRGSLRFPASMTDDLSKIQDVREVQPVSAIRIRVQGDLALLVATDIKKLALSTRNRRVIAGDYDKMHALTAEGNGVMVSENFVHLHHLKLGDPLDLAPESGALTLPIVGIVEDYSCQQGTIFLDRAVYRRYWRDDSVDFFRVYLQPGAPVDHVREAILARFAGSSHLLVLANEEVRNHVLHLADQWFKMTHVQIAVAILVAILGIFNSLAISVADRTRELGVLRALGGVRSQVRRTIWLEGLMIGSFGLLLGIGTGAVTLGYMLEILRWDFAGFGHHYNFPFATATVLVPIILTASFLSALAPAELAARGSLMKALQYE